MRQRTFSLGREEALGGELGLQLFERLEERSTPGRLRPVGNELKSTARRPKRRFAPEPHAGPICTKRAHAWRDGRSIQDDVHRGVFLLVLQAKVEMAACDGTRVTHLALDPHGFRKHVIHRVFDGSVEFGDAEGPRLLVGRRLGGRKVER